MYKRVRIEILNFYIISYIVNYFCTFLRRIPVLQVVSALLWQCSLCFNKVMPISGFVCLHCQLHPRDRIPPSSAGGAERGEGVLLVSPKVGMEPPWGFRGCEF